ncbi:CpsD/CapB family tyrosine-protein kinase [Phenylobacterium koreense]|uniref:non-specific protein-tyrosine kinase n=1 Tax=Phenylobacterium koreense TaxID=266125 RepID=A0ABV2EP18_9CAUL
MISDPHGASAEAVRTLRTHVAAQHIEAGRRGLAVCAASAGVGATFTALNLAVALAQIGTKVIVIDADLRRPQFQDFVRGGENLLGLKQYLEGSGSDFSSYVQEDVIENLSVMFSGGAANEAQELLASERFNALVERSLRDYDFTIIDTPPANTCADARRISTVVGYSIIVAKRHQTFVNDIKALAKQLREDHAQVIGAVMNEA